MIIDTHTHIYSPDEKRYPPAPEILSVGWTGQPTKTSLRPPDRASLEALREQMQADGVGRACIIQTSTFYRFDNRYICDSARTNPTWTAGVCTLDPDDPHSVSNLVHDVGAYGLRGLRSFPGKAGLLDSTNVKLLWKTAADLGIVVNVLISWTDGQGSWYWGKDHIESFERMLKQFPGLPVVVDHCLNMQVGHPETAAALAALQRLSNARNLHAKLSWVAAACREKYPCPETHSICLKIIDTFGPERCIWGSAFPSSLWAPKLTYAQHLRIFSHELGLREETKIEILGGTARRLWFRN